jgi:hypothetical protein
MKVKTEAELKPCDGSLLRLLCRDNVGRSNRNNDARTNTSFGEVM